MTGKVTVSLYCPPMVVKRVGPLLYRTAAEPMVARLGLPDGTTRIISNVVIPPTNVHEHPLRFPHIATVDACKGIGAIAGASIVVSLPEEPVDFEAWHLVAKKITAPIVLVLVVGDGVFTGEGSVVFPDCKIPFGGLAESVTAIGSAMFP